MITSTTIPFNKLSASDDINARALARDGLDELAASIAQRGLIQPLAVRPADGDRYEVIDGRRRHAAIAKLVKAKAWKKDAAIPVLVRNEDDAEALETSLVANTVRLPMHPVDQHAVLSRLVAQGKSVADLATRFGLPERTVRQQLALGRLAEGVRKAWRAGTISAEIAQAFASAGHEAQEAAWEKLKGRARSNSPYGGLQAYDVRRELGARRERLDQSDEIALVGLDAYMAAGGTITDDLFEDARYVDDVPLAKSLARERLQAECDKLTAAGWAWAALADDLDAEDRSWSWHWQSVKGDDVEPGEFAPEAFSPEEMARSGCAVSIDTDGDGTAAIGVIYGIVRPSDDGQTDIEDAIGASGVTIAEATTCANCGDDLEPGDDAAELPDGAIVCSYCAPAHGGDTGADDLPPVSAVVGGEDAQDGKGEGSAISGALMETITTAQTRAAAITLARDPALALRVLVAALRSTPRSSPAKITATPFTSDLRKPGNRPDEDFEDALLRLSGEDVPALLDRLAVHVAASLTLLASNHHAPRENAIMLVGSLPSAPYLAAAREQFLPDDYFKRATKAVALGAIEEIRAAGCGAGLAPEDVLADMKKADLAAAAASAARACGWLPEPLRHPAYALVPGAGGRLPAGESPAPSKSEAA